MRSLADELTVLRVGGGTRVTMRFAVEPETDELADPPEANQARGSRGGGAGDLVRLNRVQDV